MTAVLAVCEFLTLGTLAVAAAVLAAAIVAQVVGFAAYVVQAVTK